MAQEELPEMPFLRNVGLVMTYKCEVACPHCIIEAGPHRTEAIPVKEACTWIGQIAAYRDRYVKVLSLTGGEPFYDVAALRSISDFGASRGLLVSAVTNAHWAITKPAAVKTLRELPAIRMLAISADVHHQQAIPFERVENAIGAARECDLPFNVNVCTEDEDDPAYKAILRKIEEVAGAGAVNTALTFPAGRAAQRLANAQYTLTEDPPVSACAAGSSPIVFPDGRVIACIGPVIDLRFPHPLLLGNLRERSLDEIFDEAETNSVLHAIRVWGPRKLIALIREAGLGTHLPTHYIRNGVCMACHALMASRDLTDFFAALSVDAGFSRKVAFARLHYLRERRMAELLQESV